MPHGSDDVDICSGCGYESQNLIGLLRPPPGYSIESGWKCGECGTYNELDPKRARGPRGESIVYFDANVLLALWEDLQALDAEAPPDEVAQRVESGVPTLAPLGGFIRKHQLSLSIASSLLLWLFPSPFSDMFDQEPTVPTSPGITPRDLDELILELRREQEVRRDSNGDEGQHGELPRRGGVKSQTRNHDEGTEQR